MSNIIIALTLALNAGTTVTGASHVARQAHELVKSAGPQMHCSAPRPLLSDEKQQVRVCEVY